MTPGRTDCILHDTKNGGTRRKKAPGRAAIGFISSESESEAAAGGHRDPEQHHFFRARGKCPVP